MATGKNNPEKLSNIVNVMESIEIDKTIKDILEKTSILYNEISLIKQTFDNNELINARGIKVPLDELIDSSEKLNDYTDVLHLIEKDLDEFKNNYNKFYEYYTTRYLNTMSRMEM